MKKTSFFLFLLLIVCIGSVSATVMTVPEECTPTDYYVVLTESLDDTTISSLIATYDYSYCAPTCSGVNGTTIYFATEQDLGRFCNIIGNANPSLAFSGNWKVYTNGEPTSATVIYLRMNTGKNLVYNICIPQTDIGYSYAYSTSGDYSSGVVDVNGITIVSSNDGTSTGYKIVTLSPSFVYHANAYSSTSIYSSLVVFGDCEYVLNESSTYLETSILHESVATGLLTVDALTGTQIYSDGELLGTSDEILDLLFGTYNLTFVKSGYWNETAIVVIPDDTNVLVEQFPEDELYLVSTNIVTQNIVPNEVVSATITIEPKYLSKDTKIHFSKELESVKIGVSDVSMYGEDYILGDISEPTTITITFNSGTLTGNRYIEYQISGTTWLNAETLTFQKLGNIDYFVNELPIIVYMPTWTVGENEFRITEQEGNTLSLNVEILDSEENSIYEQNKVFNPYGVERFTVNLSASGSYILRIYCSEYDILLPFTVGTVTIEDDTEDDDTIPPIVDDSEGIFDMILNYWYFPVGLMGIVGVSKLFFGKKGRKDRKKTNKGGNKK